MKIDKLKFVILPIILVCYLITTYTDIRLFGAGVNKNPALMTEIEIKKLNDNLQTAEKCTKVGFVSFNKDKEYALHFLNYFLMPNLFDSVNSYCCENLVFYGSDEENGKIKQNILNKGFRLKTQFKTYDSNLFLYSRLLGEFK